MNAKKGSTDKPDQPANRPSGPTGTTGQPGRPFITFDQVTVRVGGAWPLKALNWEIRDTENWVVWGANGAGKTTLAKALLGEAAVVQGAIQRHYHDAAERAKEPGDLALVSSDQQFDLHRREQMLDQMRHFSGRIHDVTRAGHVLGQDSLDPGGPHKVLRLKPLLAKPLNALSAGEMRRLLIGRALMNQPRLLILDEPFNGLDAETRHDLLRLLDDLGAAGTRMVLITHRLAEIPDTFTHLLHLQEGRVTWQGTVEAFRGQDIPSPSVAPSATPARSIPPVRTGSGAPIIEMRDVNVSYDDVRVLSDIRWTVRQGEHWALIGPNGAGKSTLLKLITGDQLQGYANDLVVFGRPKGSGESVWEIKQRIGYVADDLQLRYQKKMSGFDVVCSGFFDSIGLYRHTSREQKAAAREWLRRTGVSDLAQGLFSNLSFGQQRMLLIVRAMVKNPQLLVLDEPCNGLDATHRHRLLDMLDGIGFSGAASLLYVSHRPGEMPRCITHRLYLRAGGIVRQTGLDEKG